MKLNKQQLIFISFIIIPATTLIISIKSDLPYQISSGKPIKICILDEKNPFIIKYESAKRRLIILKPNKTIKLAGTNFQKAYMLINSLSDNNLREEKIHFINIPPNYSLNQSYFIEYLPIWRKKISILFDFATKVIEIKKMSNLSYLDILTLFPEILHINPVDFFIEEIEIKGEISKEENSEEVENNTDIKMEIVNASNKKNMAFKTAKYLQSHKINVLNISNKKIQSKTEIICNNNEDIEKAKKIKELLGIQNAEIYIKKSRYRIFDITLIIGQDFDDTKFEK